MTSALALSSDPGRHAQGSRCRDHLSAIHIMPPRHHCEDLRLLGDVFRVMPHSARVRAHLSTPTIRARCAPILSFKRRERRSKEKGWSGACVHLHTLMQISARNRRRWASFDALVSFPPPSFDEGFHCRRLSPPPRHPHLPWPFDQDVRQHSCPSIFTSTFRRSLVPKTPVARTASHLSTLAIHRHFRAHARARFRVYLPTEPHLSGPSFDLS